MPQKELKILQLTIQKNIINNELQDIYIHDPDIQQNRSYTQEYRNYGKCNDLDIYNICDIHLYYTDNKINDVNDMKYAKDKNKMSKSNKIEIQ